MKCASCMANNGRDNAPDMVVSETSTHIITKCPKCGFWKGVKKSNNRFDSNRRK